MVEPLHCVTCRGFPVSCGLNQREDHVRATCADHSYNHPCFSYLGMNWQKPFVLGVFSIAFFFIVQLLLKLHRPQPLEHSLHSEYKPFSQVGGSQHFYHPTWEMWPVCVGWTGIITHICFCFCVGGLLYSSC